MNVSVNERIKMLRSFLNLSQQEFSNRIKTSVVTISRIENNSNSPRKNMLYEICREFGVSENWLLNGIGEMFVETIPNDSTNQSWKDVALEMAQQRINHLESMVDKLILRIPLAKDSFKTGIDEKGNFENCVNTVRVA